MLRSLLLLTQDLHQHKEGEHVGQSWLQPRPNPKRPKQQFRRKLPIAFKCCVGMHICFFFLWLLARIMAPTLFG